MANAQTVRQFKSKGHAETALLKWELEDFMTLIQMDTLKYNYLEFDAGQSVGLSSRWRFILLTSENKLRLELHLLKCSTPSVLVNFQWCIKQSNGLNFWINEDKLKMQQGAQGCEFKKGNSAQSKFGAYTLEQIMAALPPNLKDGSLNIEIRFWLSTESSFKTQEMGIDIAAKLTEESRLALVNDLQKLLDSGDNADIVIEVEDGKKLKAHKAILAVRSPVFFAMFQSKMLEASTGVVSGDDLSYEAMSIILKFIYSGRLDEKWVEFYEEIIDAAERYSLTQLKGICDLTLGRICNVHNAMDLFKLARLYSLKVAEGQIFDFILANLKQH